MEFNFDIRGYLKPYEKIETSYKEFRDNFVLPFDQNSTRHQLFNHYEKYTQDFSERVTSNFSQWINGSFVSSKRNPGDIDIVSLIDYRVAEEKSLIIRSEFIGEAVSKKYGIDAYLLIIYPENHKLHSWTSTDLLYWNDWFGTSKMQKQQKRYPKGYLEISYNDYSNKL